ncbi:MAG: gliding motility-associated C-terminal domain-containing protein [Bacteroidetes bacterium]|nr:gliding motility-associated C-terminal domain-containing protein [Bacteroidota bacterium]
MGTKLNSKLLPNHIYNFELFYNLANGSLYANNNLSAYFSSTQFTLNNVNPLSQSWYDTNINNINPQINYDTTQYLSTDTLDWKAFNGCFIANGGEEFLTIGNFRDGKFNKTINSNTNFISNCISPLEICYIYIDDVSLYDLGYYSGKVKCKKDTTICYNSTILIGNNIKDSSIISWQPNVSLNCSNCPNPVASPSITTKYIVTKTLCSFISKDSITVTVFTPTLTANAGPFKNICLSDTVKLGVNDTTAYTSYTWQPAGGLSCTNCPQPVTMPLASTTYTLNKKECSFNTSDTVSVFVETCEVVIPDIFTPNNDNINDEWKIKLPNGFKLKTVTVYNRWGTLVYSIDDEVLNSANSKIRVVRWDGRTTSGLECSEGVYFYVIHYTDKNGILYKKKGNLTLIR